MLTNSRPLVFLDTSIQIQRFIGAKEQQLQIERELKEAASEFVTSAYVFMEFQRSLWSDFVYVYNQMRQSQEWGTVAYRLRSGVRSHRPRSLGNCLQIFTWALIESNLDYDKALDFLELQITQKSCSFINFGAVMKAFREWTKRTSLTKNFVVHSRNAWLIYKGTTLKLTRRFLVPCDAAAGPHCLRFGQTGHPPSTRWTI